jgi:uncharacterized protein YbdZ (MbtH family)
MSWNESEREDTTVYKVVVNAEEQYSIWPDFKEVPRGWRHVGKTGPKTECLSYIKEVWTDMRPLSLRQKMDDLARNPAPPDPAPEAKEVRFTSLVDRLCERDYSVEVGVKPRGDVKLFKEAVDRQYVHIRFPETRGGTELGFRLDRDASDFSTADFEKGKGKVHIEGALTLDYVPVRCVADIDLETLAGMGRLVKVAIKEAAVA